MVLKQCSQFVEKLDSAKKQIKTLQEELNDALIAKYKMLDEAEVKKLALVKWESALSATIENDRSLVAKNLADRISQLGHRYDAVLSVLIGEVDILESKVSQHLGKMGLAPK
jgi:type I restriction enzyme M protein